MLTTQTPERTTIRYLLAIGRDVRGWVKYGQAAWETVHLQPFKSGMETRCSAASCSTLYIPPGFVVRIQRDGTHVDDNFQLSSQPGGRIYPQPPQESPSDLESRRATCGRWRIYPGSLDSGVVRGKTHAKL